MTYNSPNLILASQSPRRIELLKAEGYSFEVKPASIEETLDPRLNPQKNALGIARKKAQKIHEIYPDHFVLGADTIVVLEGNIIGKPIDSNDASKILNLLKGKEHEVMTAVSLIDPKGNLWEDVEVSKVKIKPLTQETIDTYIKSGESLDKAGAYAIQGKGAKLVDSWSGSYSNIVGLPIEIVKKMLQNHGF